MKELYFRYKGEKTSFVLVEKEDYDELLKRVEKLEGNGPEDERIADVKRLSAQQLTTKYKISDANAVAKQCGVKRPKDDNGKNVKELGYWEYLKDVIKNKG